MPFKLLKRGDSGIFVEYLQYGLHIMCFKVKPFDGIFGTNTYNAVINFQNLKKLAADGIVGEHTWKNLCWEIASIQTQLRIKGYNPGQIDGIAGEKTYNSILQFQKENGLVDDGMVGEKTKEKLFDSGYDENKFPLLKKGSDNKNAVAKLQNLLIQKGYDCGIYGADGFFGNKTYDAVIAFQNDYNLSVDGIVGTATWAALNSDYETISCFKNNNDNNNIEYNKNLDEECTDKASKELIYFIKNMEGFSPTVYKDVVGVKTLGYGLTGNEILDLNNISEEKGTQLLVQYVNNNYFNPVLKIVKSRGVNHLLQREMDAFTSFAYNLGVESFSRSTLLKKYSAGGRGNFIHDEFMRWVYAGKKIYLGLIKRRNYEWAIFSGSKIIVPGYNSKSNISIIENGKASGKTVIENNGYGASPY